jgi:hypothetical protein
MTDRLAQNKPTVMAFYDISPAICGGGPATFPLTSRSYRQPQEITFGTPDGASILSHKM